MIVQNIVHMIISSEYDNNAYRQPTDSVYIHRYFSLKMRFIHEKNSIKIRGPENILSVIG